MNKVRSMITVGDGILDCEFQNWKLKIETDRKQIENNVSNLKIRDWWKENVVKGRFDKEVRAGTITGKVTTNRMRRQRPIRRHK